MRVCGFRALVIVMLTIAFSPNPAWSAAGSAAVYEEDDPVVSFELNQKNRRLIQETLDQRGYDAGRPDGKFGRRTRAAISEYQADRGEPATGELTEEQIRDLLSAYGPTGVDLSNDRPKGRAARASARGSGRKCGLESTLAKQAHADLSITLIQNEVQVGAGFTIEWNRPELAQRMPFYIMISFNAPVRFEGNAFTALTPDAEAPFGIRWNQSHIRVLIPYSDPVKGHGTGKLHVKPLEAGTLRVEAASVLYVRRCEEEQVLPQETFDIDVFASPSVELVAEDSASLDLPEFRLASSTGKHFIDVFEKHFEVIEKTSGRRIARLNGRYPGFSPAGHFFFMKRGPALFIGDVRTGQIIYSGQKTRFHAWTLNDSFAALGNNDNRELTVVPMLVDRAEYRPKRRYGLSVTGFEFNRKESNYTERNEFDFRELFEISVDNNFMLFSSQEGLFLYTLTGALVKHFPGLGRPNPQREIERQRIANVKGAKQLLNDKFLLSPFDFRVRYTYQHVYNFNNRLVATGNATQATKKAMLSVQKNQRAEWREGTYYQQKFAEIDRKLSANTNRSSGTVTRGDWRGLTRVVREPRSTNQVFRRLQEFGLSLAQENAGEESAIRGTKDTRKELSKPTRNGNAVLLITDPGILEQTVRLPSANRVRKRINTLFPATSGQIDVALNQGYALLDKTVCKAPNHKVVIGTFVSSYRRWEHADGETWILQASPCRDKYLKDNNAYFVLDSRFKDQGLQSISSLTKNRVSISNLKSPKFRLYEGRYLLIWGADSGLFVVDLADPKRSFGKRGRRIVEKHHDLRLSQDLKHAVNVKPDGSFNVRDVDSGETKLTGRHVDDEIALWTKAGYFDATPEGAHLVRIRFQGAANTYSFQQYETLLKKPGLAARVMSGAKLQAPNIGIPPSIEASLRHRGDMIEGTVAFQTRSPAKELLVFQDGLLTETLIPGSNPRLDFSINRAPGARWVTVLALGENGLASLPVGKDLGPAASEAKLHTLAIGVNNYEDPKLTNLRYAVADAKLLSKDLSGLGEHGLQPGQTQMLLDEKATRAAILRAAEETIQSAGPNDTIVFTFAGHGVKDQQGKFYLAPTETAISDLNGSALAWDELAAVFAKSRARVIVLLDACHAGLAGSSFQATNDEAATSLLSNVHSGLLVFAASKGREFAEENAELKNGLFSLAVSDVISTNRAKHDLNGNGAIEVSELYYGVKKQVVERAKQAQTPWLARNQMVGDFRAF